MRNSILYKEAISSCSECRKFDKNIYAENGEGRCQLDRDKNVYVPEYGIIPNYCYFRDENYIIADYKLDDDYWDDYDDYLNSP